jgi:hypothetical protein
MDERFADLSHHNTGVDLAAFTGAGHTRVAMATRLANTGDRPVVSCCLAGVTPHTPGTAAAWSRRVRARGNEEANRMPGMPQTGPHAGSRRGQPRGGE